MLDGKQIEFTISEKSLSSLLFYAFENMGDAFEETEVKEKGKVLLHPGNFTNLIPPHWRFLILDFTHSFSTEFYF